MAAGLLLPVELCLGGGHDCAWNPFALREFFQFGFTQVRNKLRRDRKRRAGVLDEVPLDAVAADPFLVAQSARC